MLNGFYTAASGILTQERIFNVLGNNLANEKTPGFQAEQVVSTTYDFPNTLRIASGRTVRIGSASPIRLVREVPVHYASGLIEESGRPLDMAIDGAGFFNIAAVAPAAEGEAGAVPGAAPPEIYLTRNGSFHLDEEGYLVLPGVGRVQGIDGDIQLNTSDFVVGDDGALYSLQGEELGRLLVTDPGSDQLLRTRNGLYQPANPAANGPAGPATRLVQGGLETSNVDTQRVWTQVMESQRALQACSQVLKIIDQANLKAATQIAKL